jgi:hypothetical protein
MSFRRLKLLARLSPVERRLLFSAMLLLPLVGLSLRLFGLRRTHDYVCRLAPAGTGFVPDSYAGDEARSVARIVAIAGRRMPYRVTCLRESMVLWWLLLRRGIDAQLIVGVGKPDNVFAAHAWVEYLGQVINDDDGVRSKFVPIDWCRVDQAGRLA